MTLDALEVKASTVPGEFEGRCHEGMPGRVFGGQVLAHALVAAGRTAAGRRIHSLHGYFVKAGEVDRPFGYRVETLTDGGRFALRRVSATQGGELAFTLNASFTKGDAGHDRQPHMPRVPQPEELVDPYPAWEAQRPKDFAQAVWSRQVAMRFVPRVQDPVAGETSQLTWYRYTAPFGDEPLMHAAALAYWSDITLAPTSVLDRQRIRPLRHEPGRYFVASLDHAIWFHRPFDATEWMLYAQRSRTTSDGRAHSHGEIWTRDGLLAASVTQESVVRVRRETR